MYRMSKPGSGLAVLACLSSVAVAAGTAGMVKGVGKVETWRMAEFSFSAEKDYDVGGGDAVRFDVVFSNRTDGTTIFRPGFWDGGRTFRVRFAPTSGGTWEWASSCADDLSLAGLRGQVECVPYDGPLEIYRHGFVRSVTGKKYFVHADGTPFFYLGDTHWSMLREEFDEAGSHADSIDTDSHFKYIVDQRVVLGFSVYQSEPCAGKFDLSDGKVDASDIAGLRDADRYFRYIADKGLVHANAEFFFPTRLTEKLGRDLSALERLSRYWVARFGAWPVMWTIAQEIDDDTARPRPHIFYTSKDSPWYDVARFVHAADAYRHPLSGHQENTDRTVVSNSIFASPKARAETGHDWWAAQWHPGMKKNGNLAPAEQYWADDRPAVLYESNYCGLWTLDFGARAQGYIAFLSGFCGYGYGATDIWLYKGTFEMGNYSTDGMVYVDPGHKRAPWGQAVNFPSAFQMRHLRRFFESFDWWRMKPIFGKDRDDFIPHDPHCDAWRAAKIDGEFRKFIFYFHTRSPRFKETGALSSARPDRSYAARWFDPVRGIWSKPDCLGRGTAEGFCQLPPKPDVGDWALVVEEDMEGL